MQKAKYLIQAFCESRTGYSILDIEDVLGELIDPTLLAVVNKLGVSRAIEIVFGENCMRARDDVAVEPQLISSHQHQQVKSFWDRIEED